MIEEGWRDQGTPRCSTSTKGKRSSSRRKEYIRRDHRASCARQLTVGSPFPVGIISCGHATKSFNCTNIWWRRISLQVWLNRSVLLVELRHIRHEILNHVRVWQWVNPALLCGLRWDSAQARERVDTIDVHSARPADTLSTRPSERQGRIDLVLNANERIQHHRTGLVQVERIRLHSRLRRGLIRIPAVDVECLDLCIFGGRWLRSLRCRCFGGVRSAQELWCWYFGTRSVNCVLRVSDSGLLTSYLPCQARRCA